MLEFAAIGPVPHCGMMLADMGADIVRIDRSALRENADTVSNRGRSAIALDLGDETDRATIRAAMRHADVVIEGFRPGVMERFGLGPDTALAENPRLIYGRQTGWGQTGPLADHAGHDINYIAITGALEEIGDADRPPVPPLNLVGDFGGGSMFLALGIALALFERTTSGKGQVIDAAIVDGTASLLAAMCGMREIIGVGRGTHQLGGGWPTYRTYECSDGRFVAVGAIEDKFWTSLADELGLSADERARAPQSHAALHGRLAAIFARETRDTWCERLQGRDICIAPVLSLEEAAHHPHLAARGTFQIVDNVLHPAPAPRLSRTPGRIGNPAPRPGEGGAERLAAWGVPITA